MKKHLLPDSGPHLLAGLLVAVALTVPQANAVPPYAGTIDFPNLVTSADPTAYQGISYQGTGNRVHLDRRTDGRPPQSKAEGQWE